MRPDPIRFTARNMSGRDRVYTIEFRSDGSAKMHSRADGTLRISKEEIKRFSQELEFALSSMEFPGDFEDLLPSILIEPLEPVAIPGIADINAARTRMLAQCDIEITHMYTRREEGKERDEVAKVLAKLRRWLYREAGPGFWKSVRGMPAAAVLSHALSKEPQVRSKA